MKKKILLALTVASVLSITTACSKSEDIIQNETKKPTDVVTKKENNLINEPLGVTNEEKQMTKEELILTELFSFYLDHYQFGKYINDMKIINDTLVVSMHNSYTNLKETNPYNISYNEATFPDLYKRYVVDGNYKDLNAYLITHSAYVLANQSSIQRVIINAPPTPSGDYYLMDVNREDLQYVLGYDVNQLKKENGELDWGKEFNEKFASKYSYPLSEEAYDYNKRFLNVFSKQGKEPMSVGGEEKASISKMVLPKDAIPDMEVILKQNPDFNEYLSYADSINFKENKLFIKFSKAFEKDFNVPSDVNYIIGRVMAMFPELELLSVQIKTHEINVQRDELTNYLGLDISTLVKTDTSEVDDWQDWDKKFHEKYVKGDKKEEFFKQFD